MKGNFWVILKQIRLLGIVAVLVSIFAQGKLESDVSKKDIKPEVVDEKSEDMKCDILISKGTNCNRSGRINLGRDAKEFTLRLANQNVFWPEDSDPETIALVKTIISSGRTVFMKFKLNDPAYSGMRKRLVVGQTYHEDLDRNTRVDEGDLKLVLENFGKQTCDAIRAADINGDRIVDDADLLAVLFNFGRRSYPCVLEFLISLR